MSGHNTTRTVVTIQPNNICGTYSNRESYDCHLRTCGMDGWMNYTYSSSQSCEFMTRSSYLLASNHHPVACSWSEWHHHTSLVRLCVCLSWAEGSQVRFQSNGGCVFKVFTCYMTIVSFSEGFIYLSCLRILKWKRRRVWDWWGMHEKESCNQLGRWFKLDTLFVENVNYSVDVFVITTE